MTQSALSPGFENLINVFDGLRWRNGALMEAGRDRDAVNELHDHHELIIESKRGAQRGDVGMIEAGEDLNFAEEAVSEIFLSGKIGKQDLHGLNAIGNGVADFVDFAHASGAENAENFVVAELLSDGVVLAHGVAPFR